MSYTIVGQTSVASMFAPASVQSNEAEQESPEQVEQTEVDDNIGGNDDTTPDPQLTNETKMTDEETRSSSKRSRQPTLFESFGKINQFERVVEGLINTIGDSNQVQYLEQIKETLVSRSKEEKISGNRATTNHHGNVDRRPEAIEDNKC